MSDDKPFNDLAGLSAWDRRLIQKYRYFYISLDNGSRQPSTEPQRHFIAVCQGRAKPRTQHEIAYVRYRNALAAVRVTSTVQQPIDRSAFKPTSKAIEIVDAIEEAEFDPSTSTRLQNLFDRLKRLYTDGTAKARIVANDASLWTTTILSDPAFAQSIERWMGATFNTVSNTYTKSMDGAHALGLQAGTDYVSPALHRLFGGHTPIEAWQAVREALPNDTATQEFIGYLQALGSDLTSTIGLPVTTLTKDSYETLQSFMSGIGVPNSWLIDFIHYNAMEVFSSCIPIVAILMNWDAADTESFGRLVGGLAAGTVVAGNPILAIVVLVSLARSFHLSRQKSDQWTWVRSLAKGGAMSSLVLAASSALGGPTWVLLVAGICMATLLRKYGHSVNVTDVTAFISRQIGRQMKSNPVSA